MWSKYEPKRTKGTHERDNPLSTYAEFSGFWTPSPPLVRFSRNLSVLLYAKIGHFFDTPLPLSAYVLNGRSLRGLPLSTYAQRGRGGVGPNAYVVYRLSQARLREFAYKGGRGVQKAGKSAYVLNGSPLIYLCIPFPGP